MYRAKDDGRNSYQLFTAEMNAQARERRGARDRACAARSSASELALHYQPQVDLRTGEVAASRRWCAGSIRSAGWCRRRSSSRSPRRAA